MRGNRKDIVAGALFILSGGFFCFYALARMQIGTAFQMGPGYFPVMVGGLLLLLGVAVLVRGVLREPAFIDSHISWRAVVLIILAPVAFGLALPRLGFVAALLLTGGLAAFASRRMTPLMAVTIVVPLTAFSILVFTLGLGLNLRLVGPWLAW